MNSRREAEEEGLSESEEESSTQDERDRIEALKKKGHTSGAAAKSLEIFKDKTLPNLPPPQSGSRSTPQTISVSAEIRNAPTHLKMNVPQDQLITIPEDMKVMDYLKTKFRGHQVIQKIMLAELIFPSDTIEELLVSLRRPVTDSQMINLLHNVSYGLWNLTTGFNLGVKNAQLHVHEEIKNLRKDLTDVREVLKDVIQTFTENTTKFQKECSSVSADLRSLVQKVEKLVVEGENRRAPQTTLYKSTASIQDTEVVFLCKGSPCKVIFSHEREPVIKIAGWSEIPISKEATRSFCVQLKKMEKSFVKTL